MAKQDPSHLGRTFRPRAPPTLMLRFSESVSFDRRLAPFDIAGSKAHAAMLAHVGLITAAERDAIHAGLDAILGGDRGPGASSGTRRLEDVHMNIEHALTQRVPAAAKLHTAPQPQRPGGDRHEALLQGRLRGPGAKMPCGGAARPPRRRRRQTGTSSSPATPTCSGRSRSAPRTTCSPGWRCWSGTGRGLREVAEKANECPLGSGALAGTTLPIDREYTARLLGFVDAQGARRG